MLFGLLGLSALLAVVSTSPTANVTILSPPRKLGKRCIGRISSLGDVAAAQECTTIVIGGFTVPAGKTFSLSLPDGASVTLTGTISFGVMNWAGPLMTISGNDITFNGGNQGLVGNGDHYWDGRGTSGGVQKPDPMLHINMSGNFSNLKVINSPGRAVAVDGSSLTVSGVTVDNSAGDAANSKSGGKPAGVNTDGFDVSGNNIKIQNCVVKNQDDCVAINRGTNITFRRNRCSGGHGISIGSIDSSVTVYGVKISGNTVTNSVNGLRIKTKAAATGSTVSSITYSKNKLYGISQFGVIIDQSYPSTLGTPGSGVIINDVTFSGTNTIAVGKYAKRMEVNCNTESCTGTWDFSGLTFTGGTKGVVKNVQVIGESF